MVALAEEAIADEAAVEEVVDKWLAALVAMAYPAAIGRLRVNA